MKGITVYCSSSKEIAAPYFEAAYQLGEIIARRGLPVINGGGKMGLMAAVTDGALGSGGEAIGVIPEFMVASGLNHPGLTRTIVTADMHERKRTMAELSQGCIALPGGVGTLEELAEMLAWRKLGLYSGKVVILNTLGYYDDIIRWLKLSIEQHFTYGSDGCTWLVADTPQQAVDLILQ